MPTSRWRPRWGDRSEGQELLDRDATAPGAGPGRDGPRILVLDEPANGLDPREVKALRSYIGRLAADGAAILISSHLLAEVELLASHVVVIDDGAVRASGPLERLSAEPATGIAGDRGPRRLEDVFLELIGADDAAR